MRAQFVAEDADVAVVVVVEIDDDDVLFVAVVGDYGGCDVARQMVEA